MDYHSLKRKELQSLCRKYHIPANMTNLAMADALSALNLVDGVEKTGKSMPESQVTSNKSSAKKIQSDLIDENPRIPVGLARSRRAPLLEKSAALEEEVIPKTSAPRSCQEKAAGKIVSKAKENNKGKEKEVPVVTSRSTRLQQKSKLKMSESVMKGGGKDEAKETDMLLEKSVASEEEVIPKTSAPRTCQEKAAGKIVSKAKENNNEKEKEVPVVNQITSRSTRLQQKSKLKMSEPVLKGGGKNEAKETNMLSEKGNVEGMESNNGKEKEVPVANDITRRSTRLQQNSKVKITESVLKVEEENEADMLPVEVNVEEMKSESEVTDGVQQKSDGINGNFSKEEQENVISGTGNVDGVENTGKSMPESPISNRKSTARKPQPDLIDNEPRIRVGLARSRRAPLLQNSSASEEAIIPKTSLPRTCQEKAAGELVSKAKESNNGKETEVPVITRRSTRVQQKSKLEIIESVLKVGGKNEADRLSVEVNVEEMKSVADDVQQKRDGTTGDSLKEEHDDVVSGNVDGVEKTGKSMPESPVTSRKSTARKPQPVLIDNEPRIRVVLARSRRAPLLENTSASEEAIIPKTLAPRACQEKAAGKFVSKANESNNGNETDAPVITRRSTRVQQKPKLKITEPVLNVGGKNEADMLSVEVNVDKMKSESEVTDDDQQKNNGTNGNSSKEEHDDLVSRNVSSAMVSTELSMLEKPGDFEEITVDSDVTSEDPSTALIMGELSEASTTHAFGESTSEDCSAFTISVRESGVNVADGPYESSPLEEKTEIAEVDMESEDQPTEINEVLGDKCVLEVNGYTQMVTEAEALFGDESSPIVGEMDRFEDSDAVDRNGTLKCETELYNVKLNEVEELSLDSDCFSLEAMKESAEEAMHNLVDENCNLDAQPVEREDQLMENEVIEDKGGALEMELKVRDENELITVMVIEVEALSVVGSSPISPIVENMKKLEDSDADEEKCMLECETGLECEALSVVGSSPIVENTEKLEESDADEGKCKLECETGLYDIQLTEVEALSVVGSSPIVESMEKLGDSDADERKCKLECETGIYDIHLIEGEALSVVESSSIVENMEELEESDAAEGKCKLKCETELYDVQLIEGEAQSVVESSIVENTEKSEDSDADEGKCKLKCETAVHDVQLTEVINNLEDRNCYLDGQSMACEDKLMKSEVIEDKGVNVLESKVRYENELTYVMLSEVEAVSVGSSPIVVNTEKLEDSHVGEVASNLECETEVSVVNVSEFEELSLDSDCFYFEAMKDLMKEVMNNQEAENCTFKVQQEGDCDRFLCVNVAADFDTATICDAEVDGLSDEETYDKEYDSDVELVISDAVEENEKDNSGDENGDSFYVVEITDNLEDSEVYEVASELECEADIHVVNVSELEELSMEEVMNNQEAENTFEIQQDDCDKFQCVNVAADVDTMVICGAEVDRLADEETSCDEENGSDVEMVISDAVEENEKDNSGDAVDENEESSDADEMNENEESEVYEVASKLGCETEIYAVNVSELDELSMDSDCFYFEAMKDLMEEVMNNQEAENCTFEIQQEEHCDKFQCVNVATDFDTTVICAAEVDRLADEETSYDKESNSDVELVISDTVEENQKDNSGDIFDKNEDNPDADEISDVVATDPTVKLTHVPLATPNKVSTSANRFQEIPRMSSTKKKVATTSRSFIKVLDDNKEKKHENTAQRKLKATSLGQLRKMMKQLNQADTNNTVVKEQLHMEKRPALQQLSNNSLAHEKEN